MPLSPGDFAQIVAMLNNVAEADIAPTIYELVASAPISAFQPVAATGHPADSTVPADRGRVIGIAAENINTGFAGKVYTAGAITNPAWSWTKGGVIFLNGGSLSVVPPSSGFSQAIGVTSAAQTIIIALSPPVLI